MNYEPWAWVPLIGFEKEDVDCGVKRYLDALGFTPEGLSLFMFSPDVALLHIDSEEEMVLPADYCSYYGSSVNEERGVQLWTNLDVRRLVSNFHAAGVKVFLGLMGVYLRDEHHKEWLTMHPEALDRRRTDWDGGLSLIKRLKDGTYVQDYFAGKLVETLRFYDFDGLHAADYLSPPCCPLWESEWSDDVIGQFIESTGISLPEEVARPCDETTEQLFDHMLWTDKSRRPKEGMDVWGNYEARLLRADWVWKNVRREWIDFYIDRWTNCWKGISDAVHSIGKQVFVNNSWTHDPVEAIYRYGIDYRRLEEAGVDGIVAETVSSGMALLGRTNREWHYAFLTMFLMMGGYAPSKKRLFLHSTRDSHEQWDAIRHAPMHVERDIVSLSNVYSVGSDGSYKRCADGFLICLGDGMNHAEWEWLKDRWDLGFGEIPERILAPTLVISEHEMNREVDDIIAHRRCPTQQIVTDLMLHGLGIAVCVDISNLDKVKGPILLVNADLFNEDELEKALAYKGGPVMLIGLPLEESPQPDMSFTDVQEPYALSCMVYGFSKVPAYTLAVKEDESIPADALDTPEPDRFFRNLVCRKISDNFLSACADVAAEMSGLPFASGDSEGITIQAMEFGDGRTRVFVKSNKPHYTNPVIDMRRSICAVEIRSKFPAATIEPDGSCFQIRIPPNGITVLDVKLAE